MSAKVLGRITTKHDRPRGPDVSMDIAVPEEWFAAGATLEIQLPRNLKCATCSGGGCDACERSGAVSIRGRKDAVELVEITLPRHAPPPGEEQTSRARVVVMRIPDRGGAAADDPSLPRGNLLLSVATGAEASPGVARLTGPSVPPPPMVEVVSDSSIPGTPASGRGPALWIAIAIVVAMLLWALLRR